MKHLTNKWTLVIAVLGILLAFSSCSSEDGIDGVDGTNGIDGIQGEVGPAGADGSVIYSGEGEALAATGMAGDYYFNIATDMLYGPKKTDNSWDNADAFSLKGTNGDDGDDGDDGQDGQDGQDGINGSDGADGQDGTDGQDGSVILSGTEAPDLSLGSTGDYYLDKESFTLYGPKTQRGKIASWGVGLMLKGADGNANVRTFKLTIAAEDWAEVTNTSGTTSKLIHYDTQVSALNQEVYDNGIVLIYSISSNFKLPLPYTDQTSSSNLKKYYFLLAHLENGYIISIREKLYANSDPTEVLPLSSKDYGIKIITGTTAKTLSAYKGDDERLLRVAEDMGILD